MKKFLQPIIQFCIIIFIGAITILGTSYFVNKWEKPDVIIQKEIIKYKAICYQDNQFPPCKLSVFIKRDDKQETLGIPNFNEYLLDGKFCSELPEKYQTIYNFENGSVFLEMYKLPWTKSDNFTRKGWPKETFNLEMIN